jgi:ketosteroid isomerase-like protein
MTDRRVPRQHEELLRKAYEAFNAREIEAVIELMHPDVDWPNGMEGGRVRGHDDVREYWTRQFRLIDSRVEPVAFSEQMDGRIAVDVHQIVRDLSGNLVDDRHVEHVYLIRNGLVESMDIREG